MRNRMKKTGKHLIVDIHECKHMPTHSELYNFIDHIVELVHMRKLISPYIVKGAPNNPGITGFIIIETSHISIHTFETTNTIAMDLYSCKTFNHQIILKEVKKAFKPTDIKYKIFPR